jgi:hypothetical protein
MQLIGNFIRLEFSVIVMMKSIYLLLQLVSLIPIGLYKVYMEQDGDKMDTFILLQEIPAEFKI